MSGHRRWVVALACALPLLLGWDLLSRPDPDVAEGNRLYAQARFADALAAYREARAAGGARPEVDYDIGTAQLALARAAATPEEGQRLLADAEQSLRRAAAATDPVVRSRSNYNLGNVLYEQGRFADAAQAYKTALRSDPGAAAARYNLELALRHAAAAAAPNTVAAGPAVGAPSDGAGDRPGDGPGDDGAPTPATTTGDSDTHGDTDTGTGDTGTGDAPPDGAGEPPAAADELVDREAPLDGELDDADGDGDSDGDDSDDPGAGAANDPGADDATAGRGALERKLDRLEALAQRARVDRLSRMRQQGARTRVDKDY